MWVHGCGLFRICTEAEFSEFITPDRDSAVRIRTGGCGGEDHLGAELPHPLRAHHPGRPGAFGYLCARRVSVRDRIGALGGGVRFLAETDTEPGSCGASHHPGGAREEEDQEAARSGFGRRAGKRIRGIGVCRTAVNVRSVVFALADITVGPAYVRVAQTGGGDAYARVIPVQSPNRRTPGQP
jgi:hypothetical protein